MHVILMDILTSHGGWLCVEKKTSGPGLDQRPRRGRAGWSSPDSSCSPLCQGLRRASARERYCCTSLTLPSVTVIRVAAENASDWFRLPWEAGETTNVLSSRRSMRIEWGRSPWDWCCRSSSITCSRPVQSHLPASNQRSETFGSSTASNASRSPPAQARRPGSLDQFCRSGNRCQLPVRSAARLMTCRSSTSEGTPAVPVSLR